MARIEIFRAEQLAKNEWLKLQVIQRDAFLRTLKRHPVEVNTLVNWYQKPAYVRSHRDPNAEVGDAFYANQSYSKPRVAIATEAGLPIGFAYAANNVSGSTKSEQIKKRLSIVKNYFWLREIAVKPEHQGKGIAKQLGSALLQSAVQLQPVSAYIWPDEIDHSQEKLESLGFSAVGEDQVNIFGSQSETVRQVAMQAPSVRGVLHALQHTVE